MGFLCGAGGLNDTAAGQRWPAWVRSQCHGHLANAVAALTACYLVLLFLMCLRCAGRDDLARPRRPRRSYLQTVRPLASVALLLSLCGEVAEALLALGHLAADASPSAAVASPLVAAACSVALWLPAEMLDAHLTAAGGGQCRTLRLVPAFCSLIMAAVRALSVVQMLRWGGATAHHMRPLLGAASAVLFLAVAAIDLCALRRRKSATDRPERFYAAYSSYQYEDANLYSKATFSWLTPLLRLGNSSPIELEDLGSIPQSESTALHFKRFHDIYDSMKRKQNGSVPLWRCFFRCSWRMLSLSGIFKLLGDMVGFIGPMGISVIVSYVQRMSPEQPPPPSADSHAVLYVTVSEFFSNGYIMGILIFLSALAQGTFSQSCTHLINVEGIRIKAALQAMIYDKSLKLPLWSLSNRDDLDDPPKDACPPDSSGKAESGQATKKNEKTASVVNGEEDLSSPQGLLTSHTDFGTIINLMSEDTYNIMSFVWICHYVWAIPVKIAALMFLLYYQLGISALIGAVLCVSVMTPLQFAIGKKMSVNSKSISEANDERLRRINEVLHGIKVIKLSSWEEQYESKVQLARNRELRLLNVDSLHWAVMTFLTHASSATVTLVTFGVYMMVEKAPLPTANVFASLALFNQLTVPLFIFPITVPIIISAMVSTRRLEAFFSKPETTNVLETISDGEQSSLPCSDQCCHDNEDPRKGSETAEEVDSRLDKDNQSPELLENKAPEAPFECTPEAPLPASLTARRSVVSIGDGNFSWNSSHVLNFNDVTVPKGVVTLVVGAIGSGKTSLLLALLGEMNSSDGTYPVRWSQYSSVAYCSQRPWLLNANVRENILFGQPMKRRRYAEVIAACALQPDLDILPAQDLTEIGERGINLSGGQKHRVAIARALYSSASTVLMDDPLSALDYQVAQHLVEEGFLKLLKQRGRTLLLATHYLPLLNQADYIIVMERGSVSAQGSLSKIQSERPDLGQAWQQALTVTQEDRAGAPATAFSGEDGSHGVRGDRTARERWQLVRLVSRIGLQQRASEAVAAAAPRHFRRFSRRQSRSLHRANHYTHSFPLPAGEYAAPPDVAGVLGPSAWARPLRRTRSTVAAVPDVWRRKVTRVASLQPHDTARSPNQRAWCRPSRAAGKPPRADANGGGPDCLGLVVPLPTALEEVLCDSRRDSSATEDQNHVTDCKYFSETDTAESVTQEAAEQGDRQSVADAGRKYGRVPRRVYLTYARACTVPVFLAYFASTLLWQGMRVYTDFWLSDWTAFNGTKSSPVHSKKTFQSEMLKYLLVYSVLSVVTTLLSLTSNLVGQLAGARARHRLHRSLLSNLLRSPIKFFEATPIGRIIDRLSTDVAVIDKKLATSIQRLMQFLSLCLSAVLVNAILSPWFLLPALPMCLAYYIIQHFYRVSTRELHRLDSMTRAPVSSFFSETLGGLATIRAYGQKTRFMELMLDRMDVNSNTFLVLSAANRWLGIALDYMGGTIVLVSVIGSLLAAQFYPRVVSPSLVGLAINYTLLIPIYLNWVVKFLADVEMYMGSVERVQQYAKMKTEDYSETGFRVSSTWPERGDIVFKEVSLRYDHNRDPVIKGISLHIPAGQKVGLCGRTGSGKSSLVMSLFRMLDVSEGSIVMDGVDISKLPLHLLRSRLSVIPQDIVMFSGSIRDNLDPNRQYCDEKIWECLDVAQLKNMVETLPGGLSASVKEGGENLSVGTRQLFCLARAILQNAAVLVMDEATSSVDPATEQAFLSVALKAFAHRTVLIIAHRLSTLLDCERIIVLDGGKVIEDGSPSQLLRFENGVFSLMLQAASQ